MKNLCPSVLNLLCLHAYYTITWPNWWRTSPKVLLKMTMLIVIH